MNALDDYFDHFSDFLQRGDDSQLTTLLDGHRSPEFLRVYRNGFLKSAIGALKANYPSVVQLVGEAFFSQLAHAYVEQQPPPTGTLVGYGETFVDFLTQQKLELDYLADFALVDQAWLSALNSADSEVWEAETVQQMAQAGEDVANARVQLVNSAKLVTLNYDILEFWLALKQAQPISQKMMLKQTLSYLLVWRLHGKLQLRLISPAEYDFLSSLLTANTLNVAAHAALAIDEAFNISDYFAELLQNKLLSLTSE